MTKYGVREERFLLTQFHARKASVACDMVCYISEDQESGRSGYIQPLKLWNKVKRWWTLQKEGIHHGCQGCDCSRDVTSDHESHLQASMFQASMGQPLMYIVLREEDMVSVIHGRVVLHLSLFSDAVTEYQRQGYL